MPEERAARSREARARSGDGEVLAGGASDEEVMLGKSGVGQSGDIGLAEGVSAEARAPDAGREGGLFDGEPDLVLNARLPQRELERADPGEQRDDAEHPSRSPLREPAAQLRRDPLRRAKRRGVVH